MARVAAGLLLLAAAGGAGEPDAATRAGMDAEVAGDWAAAVRAFDAALDADRDLAKSRRQRYARDRGVGLWADRVRSLMREKRYPEAARAVAALETIDAGHVAAKGARKRLERRDVAVPELAAGVPEFPRRGPAGRAVCWGHLGEDFLRAEKLVDAAVGFLLATQGEEGGWDCDAHGGRPLFDVGVTGLALLVLVSDGPSGLEGPRGEAARRAAEWLRASQKSDGVIGTRATHSFHYLTALATEALAEYAILAGKRDALRPVLEKSRDYLVSARTPGSGWRYLTRGDESDTSVTSYVISALVALRRAGIDAPTETFAGGASWVEQNMDVNFGQIGYNFPGGACARLEEMQERFPPEYSQATTAAGAFVLVSSGRALDRLGKPLGLVAAQPPLRRYPDMYYWHAGARAHTAALGAPPRLWYRELVAAAEALANEDGSIKAAGPWGADGGRVYSTAITALALAAPYREPLAAQGCAASAFLRTGHRSVGLAAREGETATGVYVDPGTKIRVRCELRIKPSRAAEPVGGEGAARGGRTLLRGAPFACLLGRIGPEGELFRLEPGGTTAMDDCGHLFLLVNDADPDDGADAWHVVLERERD